MVGAAVSSSLDRILETLQIICQAHYMRPSYGYGPTEDFNAANQTLMPAIWVEPSDSKEMNTDQGVRVEELTLNVYAVDRINKGDSNFQYIHSDMKYLLQTIVAELREVEYVRNLFIGLSRRDIEYKPITRWSDENCNGWMVKLIFRLPVVYTPCNIPIGPMPDQRFGMFNVVDAGVNDVIGPGFSQIFINVIDAGVDEVLGPGVSDSAINVIDAGINQDIT